MKEVITKDMWHRSSGNDCGDQVAECSEADTPAYLLGGVDTDRMQQTALKIATIREWLVNSGALIRWTADDNLIMNGLTKDHKESRQHLARVLQKGEWSVQRRHVGSRKVSVSTKTYTKDEI